MRDYSILHLWHKSSKGTACSKKEYGCICWWLSNIILMTQNQVKEHERLFNIILMTQNQVKEHETIQYYTYDTKSSKGTWDYSILYLWHKIK